MMQVIDINTITEEEQLAQIKVQGGWQLIQYIENPSEAVQIATVLQYPYAISNITNQCEAAKLVAVHGAGYALRYIENPSEEIIWAAISTNPNMLRYSQHEFGHLFTEEQIAFGKLICN